jgi:Na+-driven multidrug efflux pump
MSRVRRASVAAAFSYLQFGLSMAVGIAMVPFILSRIDIGVYGLWLATGEVLAYAAMADLGILAIVPWIVGQADGRNDRDAIRRVLANGACAAIVVSIVYLAVVATLWTVAPASVLSAQQRASIGGPFWLIATVTAVVLPLRIANAVLVGLQDVRFCGIVATIAWSLDVVVTATLLMKGFGLYALAAGASVPPLVAAVANIVRIRLVAPDLLSGWQLPTPAGVAALLRDGFGGWLGGWGWRLSAASDGIVLGYLLGQPVSVARLALTSKLSQTLMQLSWVPGDSGLVGLSQLSGEADRSRVRAAVVALFTLYLTLAAAGACVVLVLNAPFMQWWVPEGVFGGRALTMLLAASMVAVTVSHAFSTIVSVLGGRVRVGVAALTTGCVQIALCYVLARRYGIIGVPIAALLAQAFVLYPLLLRPLVALTGVTAGDFVRGVAVRWAVRSIPVLTVCGIACVVLWTAPLWVAAPLAFLSAATYLLMTRHLLIEYRPVAELLRRPLARLRLEALLTLPQAQGRVSR